MSMTTNKQTLREAADAANKSSWGRWESYHPHKGARGYEVKVGVKAIAQHCLKVDSAFIAAANPATVLALLDELEAAQHEKDELRQGFIANQEEAHEAIKYATELKEQLARACAGRYEAFREVDEMQKSLDHTHRRRAIWRGRAEEADAKLEAAEKRIAELEAREVELPQRQEPTSSGHYGEGYLVPSNAGSALDYEETVEAIRAAGITVKGE